MRDAGLIAVISLKQIIQWIESFFNRCKISSENFSKELISEVGWEFVAMIVVLTFLGLYKKFRKETFQESFFRWIGANKNKTPKELERDLKEMQKTIDELLKDKPPKS